MRKISCTSRKAACAASSPDCPHTQVLETLQRFLNFLLHSGIICNIYTVYQPNPHRKCCQLFHLRNNRSHSLNINIYPSTYINPIFSSCPQGLQHSSGFILLLHPPRSHYSKLVKICTNTPDALAPSSLHICLTNEENCKAFPQLFSLLTLTDLLSLLNNSKMLLA